MSQMSDKKALEIVLTAAKTLINGHGEIPVDAKNPSEADEAIAIVEKLIQCREPLDNEKA